MCFVGLDMGTSGIKALAFDEKGMQLGAAYREVTLLKPQPGWCEHDPREVLAKTKSVLAELSARLPAKMDVIAISSHGQAVLPVDEDGEPLYNIIVTMDGRTIPQYEWWKRNADPKELYRLTGLPLASIYTVNKIMWHLSGKDIAPEKIRKFLCVQDYVVNVLTGNAYIDYSLAGRTMMLSPQRKVWDETILGMAGIEEDKLARLVPSTTIAGMIRTSLAKELGIPEGVRIVVGGHDQACGALGSGVVRPGMAMNAIGTVDALVSVLPRFTLDEVFLKNNYPCYPHVLPDRYLTMAINTNGGLSLKWYRDAFCKEEKERCAAAGEDVYTHIIEECPDRPSEIYFLPHLAGAGTPVSDPLSAGAFVGLRLSHEKGDLTRAVLDSLAYEMRQNIEAIESTGTSIEEIRAIGGGAKTGKWLQIKADIFQKRIVTMRASESAALGAAILGAVGIGAFSSCEEAVETMVATGEAYEPDPAMRPEYDERYAEYLSVYPALKEVNHALSGRMSRRSPK